MKVRDLVKIQKVLKQIENIEMNAILSYKFSKIANQIKNEAEIVDKTRIKIIEELAEKDENGEFILNNGEYTFTDENKNIVINKLDELLDCDSELQIKKIKLDELKDINFTNKQMEALIQIIEE